MNVPMSSAAAMSYGTKSIPADERIRDGSRTALTRNPTRNSAPALSGAR
jgi:hypothetical protein